jgi:glycosyltransferase involved in cell wall biosynthesis
VTILDAPSFHHRTQDSVCPPAESERLHEQINAVKDAEIETADYILTVSELARQSYIEAGVAPDRVYSITLGADINLFRTREGSAPKLKTEPVTFVFAGAAVPRKGIDILVAAFKQAYKRLGGRLRLIVVGPRGDSATTLEVAETPGIETYGSMPQAELRKIFGKADCLVLPSRHDSFGMVVIEAMACGLPVIVSEMVGAKDLVRPGQNGWVVPVENIDMLAQRMIWCAEHREAVEAMREEAKATAESTTWVAYRARFADLIRSLVGNRH